MAMLTRTRRTIRSLPYRDSIETWTEIMELITVHNVQARVELESITGIASSIILDKACKISPIIVTCKGPQTRLYCLYDDDAIDGSDANENPLGFNPLKGDWTISLPCLECDLEWVRRELKSKTTRITARDSDEMAIKAQTDESEQASSSIDIERFLKS